MDCYQIVYLSERSPSLKDAALAAILDAAQTRNAALDISGLLLSSGGHFIQVLEGSQASVSALYAKIAADPRHRNVTRLFERPAPTRLFPDWGMKLADTRRSLVLDRERIDKTLIRLRLAGDEERSQGSLAILGEFRKQLMSTAA